MVLDTLNQFMTEMTTTSVIFRIILSTLLAAGTGYERSIKRHSAGMRTFVSIAIASTSAAIIEEYLILLGHPSSWIIPSVIVSVAVISCPSMFMNSKGRLKGFTTSAGLWACSIIGISIGMGMYILAIVSFLALICTLSLLSTLETLLRDRSNHLEVQLELKSKNDLQKFSTTIRRLGMQIDDIELNPAYLNSGLSVYTVAFTISSKELRKYKKHRQIIEAFRTLDYVSYIEEIN